MPPLHRSLSSRNTSTGRIDAASADLNCDCVVDGLDIGDLWDNRSLPSNSPGCASDSPLAGDINGDGVVHGLDLGALLANWTI